MSVVARLEVIPHRDGGMSDAVARAVSVLDDYDVNYETTPTDTVIEADDAGEVFAAAEAAHRAVSDDRVITSLEVDDQRTRTQRGRERVQSVERQLGRRAKRKRLRTSSRRRAEERQARRGQTSVEQTVDGRTSERREVGEVSAGGERTGETSADEQETQHPPRYGGPRESSRRKGPRASDSEPRYLSGPPRERR